MNLALLTAAFVMSMTAFAFVATPLVRSQRKQSNGSINTSLLVAIAAFGLGIAIYGVIGNPDVKSHEPSAGAAAVPNTVATKGQDKVGSVASLLGGLEARLEEDPEDGKGWLLLAQSYELLGRIEEANVAYKKATALGTSNAELASRLEQVAETPAPEAGIRGHVSVDSTAQERVAPDAVVYIVARTTGNPMPLAVLRKSAAELPFDFVLSDANSMVQGGGLMTADEVSISVKISASGDALANDSGLETTLQGVKPLSGEKLNIVIGAPGTQ